MDTIGIIGRGFVGSAISFGMSHKVNTAEWDITYKNHIRLCMECGNATGKNYFDPTKKDPIEVLVKNVNGPIFVCVPTPMNKDGSSDISIVESVIQSLEKAKFPNTVIIKSTVPPGTTKYLNDKYNFSIIFNPEFLTEANAFEDFEKQNRIILGGDSAAIEPAREIYRKVFPDTEIIETNSTIAEMVKYVTNTFLATKVSYANEIYQICKALNINYDEVIDCATKDARLGNSHFKVPGPDGKVGFGLTCFPKDLNALVSVADSLGINCNTLKGVWKTNLEVRPEKDWEIKGRSVN